mmetsp:Transcript_23822/g.50168  ORF Transcript_23822/g.50168 Transcript_23822/m.50168 type:complete len:287 (+) Transcript_23822:2254-3114(+)
MGRQPELQSALQAATGTRSAAGNRYHVPVHVVVLDDSWRWFFDPGGDCSGGLLGGGGRRIGIIGKQYQQGRVGALHSAKQAFAADHAGLVGNDGPPGYSGVVRRQVRHLAPGSQGRKAPLAGQLSKPAAAQLQLHLQLARGHDAGWSTHYVFAPIHGDGTGNRVHFLYLVHGHCLFRKQESGPPVPLLVHGHDARADHHNGPGRSGLYANVLLRALLLSDPRGSGWRVLGECSQSNDQSFVLDSRELSRVPIQGMKSNRIESNESIQSPAPPVAFSPTYRAELGMV